MDRCDSQRGLRPQKKQAGNEVNFLQHNIMMFWCEVFDKGKTNTTPQNIP